VNPPDVGRAASLPLTDYGRNGQHLAIRSADRDIFKVCSTEPVIRLQANRNGKFIAPYPKGTRSASAYICLDNLRHLTNRQSQVGNLVAVKNHILLRSPFPAVRAHTGDLGYFFHPPFNLFRNRFRSVQVVAAQLNFNGLSAPGTKNTPQYPQSRLGTYPDVAARDDPGHLFAQLISNF